MKRAVFLDRDGVLNVERGFVRTAGELVVIDGVREALIALRGLGFLRLVVTNQSGLARGLFDWTDLYAIHKKLRRATGGEIDAIYVCPHHPTEGQSPMTHPCACRKPAPGLLERAKREWDVSFEQSWLVGDAPRDIEAAAAAGTRSILVTGSKLPEASAYPDDTPRPEHYCSSLAAAVEHIEACEAA